MRRPDLVQGAAFLFHDEGHNLLTADVVLHGGQLYRDVFFPYGPLGAYIYVVWAAAFGNTPRSYLCLFVAISAVNMILAYYVLRRAAGMRVAVAVGAALLAVVPIPGSIVGAFVTSAYVVLERTFLLLLALLWTPPLTRTRSQSLAIGAIAGVWQAVKFGGGPLAMAALLLLDLVALAVSGLDAATIKTWLQRVAVSVAAFLVVEVAIVAYAFWTQPTPIATDEVWPLFMFQAYAGLGSYRWPAWIGWRPAVAQFLFPLSAGVLSAVAIARWLRGSAYETAGGESGAVFVPMVFVVLAAIVGYVHHAFHYFQFLWTLAPGSAWILERRGRLVAWMTALLWIPGVFVVARACYVASPASDVRLINTPSGGTVALTTDMAERVAFLQRVAQSPYAAGRPAILYAGIGSGWHFAYGVPLASRHSFFFAPDVIRPYERSQFADSWERVGAIIQCADPPLPAPTRIDFAIDGRLLDALNERFALSTRSNGCSVFDPNPR
ncbi:MAG TPA: hypothetical protein VFA27_15995 [Vicinamibacterales bacterium]|nr:hypothetical protein [Vicinamibacterales bacterium]